MLKTSVLLTLLSSTLLFSATSSCATNPSVAATQNCKQAEAIFEKTEAAHSCLSQKMRTCHYGTITRHCLVFVTGELAIKGNTLTGIVPWEYHGGQPRWSNVSIPCSKVCPNLHTTFIHRGTTYSVTLTGC